MANVNSIGKRRNPPFVVLSLTVSAVLFAAASLPARAQASQEPAMQTPAAVTSPDFNGTLQPALDQVGVSLRQIQIDHWKLSREWKAQIQSDANSIHQDLSAQLPALLQKTQTSPAEIGPRLSVLRNVDALYDVLVRVTTAANLAGRADAPALESALQRLELARKTTADGLLQAVAGQDQEVVQLRTVLQAAQHSEAAPNTQPKRIVVENGAAHRTKRRRKLSHPKPASKPTPAPSGASTGSKANPER